MGLGDEIMASAQAKQSYELTGKRVVILDRRGRPRWHEIWSYNPHILRMPVNDYIGIINGGGSRPYIVSKTDAKWTWQKWEHGVGEIYFSKDEEIFGKRYAGFIIVEPNTKLLEGNKTWIYQRWVNVVQRIGSHLFLQVGVLGSKVLPGVEFIETTFRQACAVLKYSRGFVGTEGALHHAAAALSIPAVVLWSEFISPDITGYPEQCNLRHAGKACGSRLMCAGCKASMEAITVEEVVNAIQEKVL